MIIVILLASAGLYAIMYFYGDQVKQTLLAQLNQRLAVEVSVEELDVDLFTNFPRGSLRLKGINSREKTSSAGKSLLKAGEIALLFNLMDIFRGEYTIERINLQDAFLNLSVQENGDVNYRILRKQGEAGKDITLDLRKVRFKNVVISYIHDPSQQEYLFRIDEGDLRGSFSSRVQEFDFSGLLFSSHIKSGRNVFLENRELSVLTEIAIDKDDGTIHIKQGIIRSEGIDFTVTGNISTDEDNKNLDLAIDVERSSIRSLMNIIPGQYLDPFNDIAIQGEVVIQAGIAGNFSGNHIPRIQVQFSLEDGSLLYKPGGLNLSSMNFSGDFTNGESASEKTYRLTVRDFSSTFEGGRIEGELDIQNFAQPRIHTRLIATAELEKLPEILRIDTIEQIGGTMELNLEFRNQLKNFRKFTIDDFISSQTSGSMKINGMSFKLKESPHVFSNFSGSFKFNNKDLKIDEFSGIVSGSDFDMTGYFRNILAFAFVPGEPIFINADFHSDHFNLDRILETGKGSGNKTTHLSFSPRVNYNLNIRIDEFTFRKFSSTDNVGQLIQNNKVLYVRNTRLNSMDGQVTIDGTIDGKKDNVYFIDCNAAFKDVNIEKLFRDFGNFGQQNITDAHLRGNVDASVQYASTLTPDLFVDQRSVYTLADVEIRDGELIRYEPLNKLAKYVREGELEHVRFSTLKNTIRIENEVVYIPTMDIQSSSLNLSLYGEHTFDNEINYHVQLLLSEIINRKEATEEDLGDNFVQDDGLGHTKVFLSMSGSADDPVVKYDTREVRDKIASDLKKEKNELKKAFRNEFGEEPGPDAPGQDIKGSGSGSGKDFTIEWEETKEARPKENQAVRTDPVKKEKAPVKKDFIIQWDEQKDTIDRWKDRDRK